MSHHESIPLGDPYGPSEDEPQVNRPAQGARQVSPSDMEDDHWTGGDAGGDFLGLEADLVGGPAGPAPSGNVYDDADLDVAPAEHTALPQAASYAAEPEYSDGGFAGGGRPEDHGGFAHEEEYGEEPEAGDFGAGLPPVKSRRSGLLITVGLALGMGAAAVVALDYFGLVSENPPPTGFARTAATTPAARDAAPEEVPAGGLAGATLPDAMPGEPAAAGERATDLPAELTAETAPPTTRTAEALESLATEGTDPLVERFFEGEPAAPGTPAAEAATGAATGEVDWTAFEGDPTPLGTVTGWFAPDRSEEERPLAGTAGTPGTSATPATEPAGSEERPSAVAVTGEPAGPETPAPETLASATPEAGEAPSSVGRWGTAALDGLAVTPVLPPTRAADDLELMDVVWRGEEVPSDMIASAARIWTPQVGPVRVTTKRGEVFEGRLTAVGKRRVWLGAEHGEMALDGDTLDRIERLPEEPAGESNADLTSAAGSRVKVTAAGGTFEGTVLSVTGTRVTVVTDGGGRITLDGPSIEPVREDVKVKVKMDG